MSVCVLSSSSSSLSTRPARGSDTRTAALLGNKLRRLLRLPVPDRCAARCRVARRLECRCMADRYHNHTSPLLSLTYWIKHLPSCSLILPSSPKSGGKEASWSVFGMSEVTREKSPMIPNKWGPQSCFYLRHLQTDPPDWQCFVPGRCNNLYLRCYIQNNLRFLDKLQLNYSLKSSFTIFSLSFQWEVK